MKDNFFKKTAEGLLKPKEKQFANSLLVEIFFCLFFFCWLFLFNPSDVSKAYVDSLLGPYIAVNPVLPLLIISLITFIVVLATRTLQVDKFLPLFLARIPFYFIPVLYLSGTFNWGTASAVFITCFAFYLGYGYKGDLKRIIPILTAASLILSFEIFLIVAIKLPKVQSLSALKYWMKLPFGQTNYLALYLIVFMVLTNVFFRNKSKKLLIPYNAVIIAAVFFTNSRSALIVLAIYYFIEGVLFIKKRKLKLWHILSFSGVLIVGAIVVAVKWDAFYPFISRFSFESLAGNRIKVYKDVFVLIAQHPWLGRSAFAYNAFDAIRAHNFVLESLVQTGTIGTILYFGLMVVVLWQLLKIRQARARHTLLSLYALTFLHGLIEPNLFSPWSDTFVWFLFGIGCALPKKLTKAERTALAEKENEPIPETVNVSLCMCTYNGEQYLREQLDSIVNQTKLPSEIIVFDDASTDGTVAILNEYKTAHPQIRWDIRVNEKNAGWRVNFKNCLEQASGDVIFLADQDDIWMSDKLAVMTRALLQNPEIEVLVSDYTPFYMDGSIDHGIEVETEGTKTVSPLPTDKKLLHCARPGCAFALKKEALPDFFACWQPHFAHDAILWRTAALKGTLYRIDYSSILFRRHSSNASSNQNGRISAAERNSQKKILSMYRDCIEALRALPLSKKSAATLDKVSKWNEKRIALYENPSIWKWIALCVNVGYYQSIKSYLKDLNSLLYKG